VARSPRADPRVHSRSGRPRLLAWAVVLAMLLAAFLLRLHRLDAQSLWGDEMWSYYHTGHDSLGAVLESVRQDGVHPPLYYLVLRAWQPLAGESEYAIRYPSALFGTLAVAAIYALGRRMGGVGTGVIAGLLHTISPIHIYYSHEARMYSLTVLLVILSTYFFWRLLHIPGRRPRLMWLAYVVTSGLAINTHIFAIPILGAQALLWMVDLVRWKGARRAPALRCAAAQAATLVLFLPWMAYVWDRTRQLSTHVQRMGVDLLLILRRCLSDFSAGVPVLTTDVPDLRAEVIFPFLLLSITALVWPWRKRVAAFLALAIACVVAGVYFVSFPPLRGWTRFFLAASPFYHLLLARGADGVGHLAQVLPARKARIARGALVALVLLPVLTLQTVMVHAYYTDPLYSRWDYRGQMAEIIGDVTEGAAVVLQGRTLVFDYYFPRDSSYLTIPSRCGQDETTTAAEIAQAAAAHDRIWLVRAGPTPCDPNQRVEQWLRENAYRVEEAWLEDNLYGLYLTPGPISQYSEPADTEQATFEGLFQLESYAVRPEQLEPGDDFAVALRWRPLAQMETDFKFFLVLLAPDGGALAQRDGMPLNWLWPTTRWRPGEPFQDRWGMALPPEAPAGEYLLYVGAYDPAAGKRLQVWDQEGSTLGDMLLVARLRVS
jgi:4-amino-4-deoxy-L-arabinose transferase-like glycosyltransferase